MTSPSISARGAGQNPLEQAVLTKRIFLSNTNYIFDPVGLMTPLTITLKVILKEMFPNEYELKWDTELPSELKKGMG